MIQRPTLSNVPAAEESAFGSTPNLEDDNASTNVSINANDNEQQAKKNLGTKRKVNFQEEVLHSEKRKIKLTEERLMKSPKPTRTKFTCTY
jgi:hypothetical protein